jgi:hypothetical protein
MSQGPTAEDLHEGTDDLPQPPMEDVMNDGVEESQVDEFELDPDDVEILESSSPSELPKDFNTDPEKDPRGDEAYEEVINALRIVRENVGQTCELIAEENKIVGAFSQALHGMMLPLAKAIPVDPSALPVEMSDVRSANVIPEGKLLIRREDSRMESINLTDGANRDLLIEIIKDVMPKFSILVSERRERIEGRMSLLASITKELQNIAEALISAVK